MTPAEIIPLRTRRELPPQRKRRPKPRTGEVELFHTLDQWGVPVDYEMFFFPLEFYPDGQLRRGFQPDGRVRQTRHRPELYLELALGGYCRQERAIVEPEAHRRTVREKLSRIEGLYRHYGFRTVLIDGPLFDAIVHRPGGRRRLYQEMDAVFDPAWASALAA